MDSSTVVRKYPTFRDKPLKNCQTWLAGKCLDDNAEALWRVHDKLYDLTNFVRVHPGGADWIEMTQGIDITEQFETHHITDKAEQLLHRFYVRDAALPRNYKITFESDGFYKTLKRRVAKRISTDVNSESAATSKLYCDLMLAATVLSLGLVTRNYNCATIFAAAVCLLMLTVVSHNFIHQRDNWRMYLINFNLQTYREWRGEEKAKN